MPNCQALRQPFTFVTERGKMKISEPEVSLLLGSTKHAQEIYDELICDWPPITSQEADILSDCLSIDKVACNLHYFESRKKLTISLNAGAVSKLVSILYEVCPGCLLCFGQRILIRNSEQCKFRAGNTFYCCHLFDSSASSPFATAS